MQSDFKINVGLQLTMEYFSFAGTPIAFKVISV